MKILFIIVFFLTCIPNLIAAPCTEVSFTKTMNERFYAELNARAASFKTRLVIFPFVDGGQIGGDETLSNGLPFALYDVLKQGASLGVLHPFTTMNHPAAFEPGEILPRAQELGATHMILGMFQKMSGDVIRFFIKIVPVASPNQVTILEFNTEQTSFFYATTIQAAQAIARTTSGQGINSPKLKAYEKASPNYEAYRFYLKGMAKSAAYASIDLEIAKAWFDKSYSRAYNFYPALEEGARTLWMLALIKKQSGQDPTLEIFEAKQWWQKSKQREAAQPKKVFSPISSLRWLDATEAYSAGLSLLNSGQLGSAVAKLQTVTKLVPEDLVAQAVLGDAMVKSGKNNANSIIEAARQANPCLSPAN